MKKFSICLAALMMLLTAVFAAGCGDTQQKETPEASMTNYTAAVLRFDAESARKIGRDPETLREEFKNSAKKGFDKTNHRKGAKYAQEDLDAYANSQWDGLMELMPRVNYEIHTVKSDEQAATVEITLDVFDCPAAMQEMAQEMGQSGQYKDKTDGEILTAIGKNSLEKFRGLQPARRETLKIACTYNKKNNRWEPNGGVSSFANKLYTTASGQKKAK